MTARQEKIEFAARELAAMDDSRLSRWLWWNRPGFSAAQVRALRLILGQRFGRCW